MVSRLDPTHSFTDLLDHAGTLVATDDRKCKGNIASDEVLVTVTQPASRELDEYLPGSRGIKLDLLDAPGCVGLP